MAKAANTAQQEHIDNNEIAPQEPLSVEVPTGEVELKVKGTNETFLTSKQNWETIYSQAKNGEEYVFELVEEKKKLLLETA